MILLSVGTQLPFDRLVRAVDQWAGRTGRGDVVAQIGPSSYSPAALRSFAFCEYRRFRELQQQCDLMVSHAGMGSIITAMELGKPIVVLARDDVRGEHRNGHQVATLRKFSGWPGVYPAADEDALVELLDRADALAGHPTAGTDAPHAFVARLAEVVNAAAPPSFVRRLRLLLP